MAIASDRVTSDCPSYYLCWGYGEQTFQHWIILYTIGILAFNKLQIDKAE
ncbi:hypothetical protein PIROE2DRAFT_15558 [Piromyces sp. E2]|nr:hypothetical protein PIROE2DRAFT_15558 [Piromyces sp. E2]|eukprot:OUM59018.1 hypothetical protein PIROE2DRAFT_15558 [Piromyces sp. E2]